MKIFRLRSISYDLLLRAVSAASACETPPSFVFLIGEGQKWNILSVPRDDRVHGSRSSYIQTPKLDRVAMGGMRFTNFYAPSLAARLHKPLISMASARRSFR